MRSVLAFFFSFLVLFILAPGCDGGGSTSSGGGGSSDGATIVVGLTSDLRVGVDIDSVRVMMRAGDEVIRDTVLHASGTNPTLELPAEFSATGLGDQELVEVEVEAFRPGVSSPLLTRLASTKAVAGKELLLRVHLDSRCVAAPGSMVPTCVAPQTCVAAVCTDSFINPSVLPAYSPSWSQASNDTCKPGDGDAPVVIVGRGQSDFLPMNDLDVAQVEAGPQGGHHIWVAIRLKNLLQSGSITAVSGHVPDLDLDLGPYQVIFTFEPDEGGYCKLFGLRFQLDQTISIQDLLGKVVKVTVKVTDKDGDVGIGERTVTLSDTIL